MANYEAATQQAQNVASTPYTPYNGKLVAGINYQQQAGINALDQAQNVQDPYNANAFSLQAAQQGATTAGIGYQPQAAGLVNTGAGYVASGMNNINAGQGLINSGSGLVNSGQGDVNAGMTNVGTGIGYQGTAGSMIGGAQGLIGAGESYQGQAGSVIGGGLGAIGAGEGSVGQGIGTIASGNSSLDAAGKAINTGQGQVSSGSGMIGAGAGVLGSSLPLAYQSASTINPTQFSAAQVGQYESPYQNDVINSTMAEINNQNQQQSSGLTGNAISAGAFGGDRAGVAQAALAGQQDIASNATLAGLNNQNYQQAVGEFNNQQTTDLGAQQNNAARQLAASQQIANVGLGYGTLGSENVQAGLASGTLGNDLTNVGLARGTLGSQEVQGGLAQGTLGTEQGQLGSELGQVGMNYGTLAGEQGQLGSEYGQIGMNYGTLGAQQGQLGLASGTLGSELGTLGSQSVNAGLASGTLGSQYGQLGSTLSGIGATTGQLGSEYGTSSNQIAALGQGVQNEALAGANAMTNAGTLQQQTQQAQDTAAYNQFLQQQAYPFQTTGWLSNIVEGLGSQSGGSSTGTSETTNSSSGASAIAGGLLGLGSFLARGGRVPAMASGGGLGGGVAPILFDPSGYNPEPGYGGGDYVPAPTLPIGHTMPNSVATTPGGAASAASSVPSMQSIAKGVQGLGNAFTNSSLGDQFSDFTQDLGGNISSGLSGIGLSRGGLVGRAYRQGGSVIGDAGIMQRPHFMGGGSTNGVAYATQLDSSKGWGDNNITYQPPADDTFGSSAKGVTLPPWANSGVAAGPTPVQPVPGGTGGNASYVVRPVQMSDGSYTTTQNLGGVAATNTLFNNAQSAAQPLAGTGASAPITTGGIPYARGGLVGRSAYYDGGSVAERESTNVEDRRSDPYRGDGSKAHWESKLPNISVNQGSDAINHIMGGTDSGAHNIGLLSDPMMSSSMPTVFDVPGSGPPPSSIYYQAPGSYRRGGLVGRRHFDAGGGLDPDLGGDTAALGPGDWGYVPPQPPIPPQWFQRSPDAQNMTGNSGGDFSNVGPPAQNGVVGDPSIYRNRNPNNLPVAGQPMTDEMPSPGSAPYNPPIRDMGQTPTIAPGSPNDPLPSADFAAERAPALANVIAAHDYLGNQGQMLAPSQGGLAPNSHPQNVAADVARGNGLLGPDPVVNRLPVGPYGGANVGDVQTDAQGNAIDPSVGRPTGLAPVGVASNAPRGPSAGVAPPVPPANIPNGGTGFLHALTMYESGNRNIPNVDKTTDSGQAQGNFQITTGTWKDFAPKAGVDLSKYPNALSAPYDIQLAVAQNIPMKRWAPETLSYLRNSGYSVDTHWTLGENMVANNDNVSASPTAIAQGDGASPALAFDNNTGRGGQHSGLVTAPAMQAINAAMSPNTREQDTWRQGLNNDPGTSSNGVAPAASSAPSVPATPAAERTGLLGLNLSSQTRQQMLMMGMGIMGGTSMNPWVNIGQGALSGMKSANEMNNTQSEIGLRNAQTQNLQIEGQQKAMQLKMMNDYLEGEAKNKSAAAESTAAAAPAPSAAPSQAGAHAPSGNGPAPNMMSPTPMAAQGAPALAAPQAPAAPSIPADQNPTMLRAQAARLQQQAAKTAMFNPGMSERLQANAQQLLSQANEINKTGRISYPDGKGGFNITNAPGFNQSEAATTEARELATGAAHNATMPTVDPLTGAKYVGGSGAAPSGPVDTGEPQKPFAIDPETAAVSTSMPTAPRGGGYIVPNLPAGAKLTELPEATKKQMETDAEFQKDQISTLRANPTVIARTQAIAQAFKTFQSGTLADHQHDAAALAVALGQPGIAQKIMGGSVSGPEWVDKEGVQSVLDTLKSATPRFAQSEFNAVAQHGTPNTTNQPQANHEMVAEMLALGQRNNAFMKDWEAAKQHGWASPSAFYEAWDNANPLPGFIKSAQRQIGNFAGMDLPTPKEWTKGSIYVAPPKLPPATGQLLGKYGIKPGMMFRFNGNKSDTPLEPIAKSDYFSAQLGQ